MKLQLTEADIRTMITAHVESLSPFFKVTAMRLGYDWAVDVSLEPLTLADVADGAGEAEAEDEAQGTQFPVPCPPLD